MAHVIGIDLDTITSRVAVWNPHLQDVTHIPNLRGEYATPSFISFDQDGQVNIGSEAQARLIDAPQDTLCALNGSFEHFKSSQIRGMNVDWQTATAIMLSYLKQGAEAYLQEPVFDAVLTCPAHYTMTQRNALFDAGLIAGLNIRYLLSPSTAAAISDQFFNLNSGETKTLLIVNLGGDSLECTVVEIGDNVTVHGSGGNSESGSLAIGKLIYAWAVKQTLLNDKIDFSHNEKIKNELLLEASAVIKKLVDQKEAHLVLKNPVVSQGRTYSVDLSLTREKCSAILAPLILDWTNCIEQTLVDTYDSACVGWADLDGFLLAGELARLPILQETISECFRTHYPGKKVKNLTDSSPEEAAVKGAALLAGTKVPFGISPFESDEKKTAAQGHNLSMAMDEPEFELFDITPHSLGIGLVEHQFYPVIKKGSAIPLEVSVPGFSNANAATTQMVAEIFEGEEEYTLANHRIGEVVISIEPLPAGQHNHSIEFIIDVSGRFSVSCSDLLKEEPANYTYHEDARLSNEDIRKRCKLVDQLMGFDVREIHRTVLPIADLHSPPVPPVNREIDFDALNIPIENIPLEWRNYWKKCQSLLPNLDPAQRALLGQAMNSFMVAINKGDPQQIEACGHLLQDALLEVWM